MSTRLSLSALSRLSVFASAAVSAQTSRDLGYNPFYSCSGGVITSNTGTTRVLTSSNNSGTNLFSADTGRLHVGTVQQAIGGELDGEVANDMVLKVTDDGHFERDSGADLFPSVLREIVFNPGRRIRTAVPAPAAGAP